MDKVTKNPINVQISNELAQCIWAEMLNDDDLVQLFIEFALRGALAKFDRMVYSEFKCAPENRRWSYRTRNLYNSSGSLADEIALRWSAYEDPPF